MSVLINGMEMPTSCNACMFDVYGLCLINKNIEGKDELTHSCPLVPIPPHGRLIDADALEQDAQKRLLICNKYDNQFQKPYEVMKAIAFAPTIIEAEEGEW